MGRVAPDRHISHLLGRSRMADRSHRRSLRSPPRSAGIPPTGKDHRQVSRSSFSGGFWFDLVNGGIRFELRADWPAKERGISRIVGPSRANLFASEKGAVLAVRKVMIRCAIDEREAVGSMFTVAGFPAVRFDFESFHFCWSRVARRVLISVSSPWPLLSSSIERKKEE